MKKRILKDIVLNEISGVTKPAQSPAIATIMKSAPEFSIIEKWFDEKVNYSVASLQSLMATEDKREDFIEARNKIYDAIEALADGIAGVSSDDSLTPDDKTAKISLFITDFASIVKDKLSEDEIDSITKHIEGHMANELDTLKKALEDKTAEFEKMSGELAALKAEADKKKKAEEMKKNDETVTFAGQTISKSAVGDESFAVFKVQAEAFAKMEADVKKSHDDAEMARFEKTASTEFAHLPGTAVDIAKMLKGVAGLDADVSKSLTAVLKAFEDKNAEACKTVGVEKSAEVAKSFDDKVSEIMKRDSVSKSRAMEIAGLENPDIAKNL